MARSAGFATRRAGLFCLFAVALLLVGSNLVAAQPDAADSQQAAGADVQALPQAGRPLRDRDFGVGTQQFGLERVVEMYQWRASGDGYQQVWNSARIDSASFAPGHENPASLPLQSQRWWAQAATLDGIALGTDVLRTLGSWQGFRPDFARLPANLAASFQPEGDGLGSSENPLAPQVGDLRVRWRELVLPPLAGKLELRGGVWQLTRAAAVAPPRLERLIELPDDPQLPLRRWWPWLAGVLAAASALWWLLRRRRPGQDA